MWGELRNDLVIIRMWHSSLLAEKGFVFFHDHGSAPLDPLQPIQLPEHMFGSKLIIIHFQQIALDQECFYRDPVLDLVSHQICALQT